MSIRTELTVTRWFDGRKEPTDGDARRLKVDGSDKRSEPDLSRRVWTWTSHSRN